MQICEQGAKNLACWVIRQSAQEYMEAYGQMLRHPAGCSPLGRVRTLETFFLSQRFELFGGLAGGDIEGQRLIQQLRRRAEERQRKKGGTG